MSKEFKRMMELAGLAEIKVNEPKRFTSIKLPYLSLDADILISNDDLEEAYGDLTNGLVRLNPQIDPYFFKADDDGLWNDVMDSISENNPEGTTLIEFYKIYFYWLIRNLVADYDRYEDYEMNGRYDEFDQYTNEFVENAINGRWLNIKTVTAK